MASLVGQPGTEKVRRERRCVWEEDEESLLLCVGRDRCTRENRVARETWNQGRHCNTVHKTPASSLSHTLYLCPLVYL